MRGVILDLLQIMLGYKPYFYVSESVWACALHRNDLQLSITSRTPDIFRYVKGIDTSLLKLSFRFRSDLVYARTCGQQMWSVWPLLWWLVLLTISPEKGDFIMLHRHICLLSIKTASSEIFCHAQLFSPSQSNTFKVTSRKISRKMLWKNRKMMIIIAVVSVVLVTVIVLIILSATGTI